MKIRKIEKKGYDNGASLVKAWSADGLALYPGSGRAELNYLLSNEESLRKLGYASATEGVSVNLLQQWEKYAIEQGNNKMLERIRAWDEKKLLEAVEKLQQKVLAHKFDRRKYPEIQGLAAYRSAEAKGIADVLGVDYRRVLLCNGDYTRYIYRLVTEGREGELSGDRGCTPIAFKSSPKGPIVGMNLDAEIAALTGLQGHGEPVVFQYPEEMGYSYENTTCVNSQGLTLQGSSITYPQEAECPLSREIQGLIIRFCKNVTEALDLIERYNHFYGPANLLVVDARGDAAAIEKSKNTFAVRRTKTNGIFTTDGVAVEAKTRKIQGDNTPAYQFGLQRHQLIEKLLKKEAKAPSVEAMQRIMTDHTMPSPVCKHLDKMPSFYQLVTLYTFILVPEEKAYYFNVIHPGPIYPCQQEPVKYSYWFD